jgi:trehalose synthase
MLNVEVGEGSLDAYKAVLADGLYDEVRSLAKDLKGARVAHVNATAHGGGVAEILRSIIPLYRDIGIDATWLVIEGNERFFSHTKQLHNALQGAAHRFEIADWDHYMKWNEGKAKADLWDYDVVFIHDPQPAGIRQFVAPTGAKWVWRCHIDTSEPNREAWGKIRDMVNGYDAAIFSTADFVGPGLTVPLIELIAPAIDPLTPKNMPMPENEARAVVASYGIDPDRPFISQVSRFDPWKDPLGVVACFGMLKEKHPTLQLAMLGNFADDDPEGHVMFRELEEAVSGVPDVNIITDLTDLVNPFQALSQVILQKSTREGFGLTVTEALWKGTPVVAGNVGGIRLQIVDGAGGFLVSSVEECAAKVDYLLLNEDERIALGKAGRERVRAKFLLPRLLRDELALMRTLLNSTGKGPAAGQDDSIGAEAVV